MAYFMFLISLGTKGLADLVKDDKKLGNVQYAKMRERKYSKVCKVTYNHRLEEIQ